MIPRTRFAKRNERPSGIVTLLTDLGTRDPFVGMMTGVIVTFFPEARVVTLSHDVPARNVLHGAFWLSRCYDWFPEGTVHLAVVDPGVVHPGRATAVRAGGHYFVGPDNGLLSAALERASFNEPHGLEIREIDPARFELEAQYATRSFYGRDLFAPAAADLASGRIPFEEVGERVEFVAPSPVPRAARTAHGVDGEVVCIDHFGNVITNIDRQLLSGLRDNVAHVDGRSIPILRSYFDVPSGAYVALVNALGTLEVARRDSDAADSLGTTPGDKVKLR